MLVVSAVLSLSLLGAEPELPVTRARADGKGRIDVNLVYFAEHTCMSIVEVREGPPPTIETPKRTPTVTVVLGRRSGEGCQQRLTRLERSIARPEQDEIQ